MENERKAYNTYMEKLLNFQCKHKYIHTKKYFAFLYKLLPKGKSIFCSIYNFYSIYTIHLLYK